jgi:hypothetical protein
LIFNAFLTSDNIATRTNVYFNTNGTISNCIDVEGVFLNTTHDDEGTSSVVLYNNSNNETLGTFDNTGIISSRQQMTYDVGCNFVVIVAWIGIVLTNTVLFAKTYRVYKVTLFRRNQTVKPRNVLGPYIMLVFFSATVLIALTVTSPIHYSTNVYIPLDIFCQCTGTKTLNIAMFTIDIIISLGILVLAWKVRNTNEEISESRKIFILIILGVVLDIAIVVDFALIPEIEDAQINPFLTHSIFAIILILKSLLPIWFLICPRMYYVWYEYKHGHLPESVILPGIGRVHVAGTN